MIIAKPKDFRGTFRKLLRFMRPHWMGMTAIILLAGATTLASSLSPKIMGSATNEIVRGAQSLLEGGSGVDFGLLARILMLLMAVYVATSLLRYAQNYVMAGVSQRTMYDLRQAVDRKLSRLPLEYYDTHAYGDILSRVTNDVDTVSDSLQSSIISAFRSALSVVITLVMMLTISPRLTLIGLVTVPITLWFSSTVVKKTQRFFKGQQSAMGRLSGYIEEMYTAHSIIKAYSGEEDACRQFSEINRELRDYGRKAQFISGVLSPIVGFIGNAGYVLVTVVGAMMILGGELLVGDLQAFIRYLRQLSDPINETVSIVNVLQSTVAAAERIFEVLDADEEIPEREPPVIPPESRGAVEITDVHFGYEPGIEVIRGLDVSVQPGEQVALVGETGAGKTTIVNLIMRFYDVTQGSIKVCLLYTSRRKQNGLYEHTGTVCTYSQGYSAGPPDDPGSQGPVQRDLYLWSGQPGIHHRGGRTAGPAGGGDRPYLGRDGLLHAAQGEGRRAFPCYGRDAAGTGRFPELTSGKYQQTGSFSDWNCLFLFYKNPLYFQCGYAILGMYLGNYKYYAIQNIIVYKTKGANLYETDGR